LVLSSGKNDHAHARELEAHPAEHLIAAQARELEFEDHYVGSAVLAYVKRQQAVVCLAYEFTKQLCI
jgi:hypothetical protein